MNYRSRENVMRVDQVERHCLVADLAVEGDRGRSGGCGLRRLLVVVLIFATFLCYAVTSFAMNAQRDL